MGESDTGQPGTPATGPNEGPLGHKTSLQGSVEPMDVKESVMGGVAWTSLSFVTQNVMQTAISILLARILLPDAYGIVALASTTLTLIGMLRSIGAGPALIQNKAPTEEMMSSVFWFNGAVGLVSTLILLALAYPLGSMLAEPRVVNVFLLLAPNFFLGSLTTVHGALLSRQRRYRLYALREIAATLLSGLVAVVFAYSGFGYYALVLQGLTRGLFGILFLWRTVAWRPKFLFDWPSLKEVMGFGLPLAGTNIFTYLARNLDNLLVGRFLGVTALGLYGFAYGIVQQPIRIVQSILGRVMFPELSRIQADLPKVRSVYLSSLRYISALLWLPLGGLLVLAPVGIPLIYGKHWEPAVLLFQIFLLVVIPQTIATTVGWIYNSQGKTKEQFTRGLVANLFVYAGFVIGLRWGLLGVALSYLIVNYVGAWPFNALAFSVIGLRMRDVLGAVRNVFLALLELMAGLYITSIALQLLVGAGPWTIMGVGAVVGTGLYGLVLWILEPDLPKRIIRLPLDLKRSSRKVRKGTQPL